MSDFFAEHGLPNVEPPPAAARAVPRFPLTDAGNAERFADMHKDRVRFVHGVDRWLVWDGTRWAHDTQREVYPLAIATVRSILAEAADASLSQDEVKAIIKHAKASERKERIEALLSLARPLPPIAVRPDDLDRDPDLLNVENGTIDLRTGQLRPHDPADLITNLVPVPYDATATAPTWEKFLARVLPDPELRAYVQAAAGYSMTGHVTEHAAFFCYGSGNNGKSVFLETVLAVADEYGKPCMHGLLLASKQDRHAAEMADLMGARFVTTVETGEGRAWDEAKLKWLTGGDTVSARWMRGNPFTFKPTHKFWVAANHKPRARGTDNGFWRRIHLIPFTVTIPQEEVDRDLAAKLRQELPGILRWLVDGALAWRRAGLQPPTAVVEATRAYRESEDMVGSFIAECCEQGEGYRVLVGAMHEKYRAWSGDNEMSVKAFGNALEERRFERKRSNGRRWILGLRLGSEVSEEG